MRGGGLGLLDRSHGVFVLFLPPESVVPRAFLGCETHVSAVVGVAEAVADECVHEFHVAEFRAGASVGQVVRGVGHGFGAAREDAGGGSRGDGLGAEDDGFEGGGADFVDGGADCGGGEAGGDGALAGGVLAQAGGEMLGRVMCFGGELLD